MKHVLAGGEARGFGHVLANLKIRIRAYWGGHQPIVNFPRDLGRVISKTESKLDRDTWRRWRWRRNAAEGEGIACLEHRIVDRHRRDIAQPVDGADDDGLP